MKKGSVLLILLSALAGPAMAALSASGAPHDQPLKVYIADLRAKGEKMTFQELIASHTPHKNNSVAVLTNVVQQLGPPSVDVDMMRFVGPGCAQVAWKLPDPSWANSPPGSARLAWADVSNRLTAVAAPLARLRETMRTPAPNAGVRFDYFATPTPYRAVQAAALWLSIDTLWNLRANRLPEALASLEALAGLANLHREEYYLVSQMTRGAVAGLGLKLTWEALQAGDWSDPQLLALQNCWASFDFLEAAEKGLEGERCSGREAVNRYRSTQDRVSISYYEKHLQDGDLLCQLRHVQGYVEQARALQAGRGWAEVSASLDQLNARIDALTNSPQRICYPLTLIASPNLKPAVWTSARRETERRLAVTAVALERYRRQHGQFPATLDSLAPRFLPSVPRDCMNGQPLRYRLREKDSFLLYSVGEDGRDDGGDATPAKPGGKPGLWEGRDVVWPLPEK